MTVDKKKEYKDNNSNFIYLSGEETIKINKRDLNFVKHTHKHHYKPDFSDEWDEAIALKCVINGCSHGRMHPKKGKEFMDWLDEHRAQS